MRYRITADASLRIDSTQVTSVKSIPHKTTALWLLSSAKILTFSKNCMMPALSSSTEFLPPGRRSILITEYKVMALTTWRGPSAKTVFIQPRMARQLNPKKVDKARGLLSKEKYANKATYSAPFLLFVNSAKTKKRLQPRPRLPIRILWTRAASGSK